MYALLSSEARFLQFGLNLQIQNSIYVCLNAYALARLRERAGSTDPVLLAYAISSKKNNSCPTFCNPYEYEWSSTDAIGFADASVVC